MNTFSIAPFEHQQILEAYKQWLVRDLYQNYYIENLNDPSFLQKLSILQAEGIRHDIMLHAAITNSSIKNASSQMEKEIVSAVSVITSSLDDGFALMNNRMVEINGNLQSINKGVGAMVAGVNTLNNNLVEGLTAINSNISQLANVVKYQLQQVDNVLRQILIELKIPESQRERRYHIEEGMKYFNKGMSSGDCLYFDDALDEFTTAISIEKKDYFSWYYMGMIYLYSKEHLDPEKALAAFDYYIHYANALPQRHSLFDEALLMKAECKYLLQDLDGAYKCVEPIIVTNNKAALRAMKYLSASTDNVIQKQAVGILNNLVIKNPYIVMQILEDYDLLSNGFIMDYLINFRKERKNRIVETMNTVDKEMGLLKKYPVSYYKSVFDEINTLKSHVSAKLSNAGIIDVINLDEQLQSMAILEKIRKALVIAENIAITKESERTAQERQQQQRQYLIAHGYIDLGLPSGTVWKKDSEKGFYDIFDARHIFGRDKIPSSVQWHELLARCQWSWSRSLFSGGYKITGPNGASIFLSAKGLNSGYGKRTLGSYLSNTSDYYLDNDGDKRDGIAFFSFGSNYKKMKSCHSSSKMSVHLAY